MLKHWFFDCKLNQIKTYHPISETNCVLCLRHIIEHEKMYYYQPLAKTRLKELEYNKAFEDILENTEENAMGNTVFK